MQLQRQHAGEWRWPDERAPKQYGLDTLALRLPARKEHDGTVSLHLCVAGGRTVTKRDTLSPRDHKLAKVLHLYRKKQENRSAAEGTTTYSPENVMRDCSGTCCKMSTGQEKRLFRLTLRQRGLFIGPVRALSAHTRRGTRVLESCGQHW